MVDSPLADALRDRYTLERELGRGGMATVFLAHDLKHDRPVALKVLHPELAHALGPGRFQREIRFAARLQHPHILSVHDSGETAGYLWFTMPYVEGESLEKRLGREHQLAVEDALRITQEAAEALDYAHRHGVVHRDVKPANILLTGQHALVADFGIARGLGIADERMTEPGVSVGTPRYMSPEQATGERDIDGRTDVYSLGCILYEMLAGEPPFTGPTVQAVIGKRMSGLVPRVRFVRPSVSEALDQVITKALAPVPADRFGTAAELGRALAACASAPSVLGNAAPDAAINLKRLRFSRRAAVVVAGVSVVLVAVGGFWRSHRSGASIESRSDGPKRLAVLPFESLGDTSAAYFADGVAAEIRGKLASLVGLTVVASSSSEQYRHTTKPPQDVAHELGVQYLLLGHVQWGREVGGGGRVRVSPELVDAMTGATKWQQSFDAPLTDVFEVQADIANRVAEALDVALGMSERRLLAQRPTTNLAAYDVFLKGEALSVADLWDPATLRKAIGFYERAVALDSTFAPAWAQLARSRAHLYWARPMSSTSAEGVRLAAERARTLAPGRPASQLAWGSYLFLVRNDVEGALRAYEAGLQVAPTDAELLTQVGTAEYYLGRWEAAIRHLKQAQALDPRAVRPPSRLAVILLALRQWPEAREEADRALALAPSDLTMLRQRIETYVGEGDPVGAKAALREAMRTAEPIALFSFLASAYLYWLLDSTQQVLLLRLEPAAFDNDRGSWGLALANTYALRGDQARALLYADSARLGAEQELRESPDSPGAHTSMGVALAYLGRKTEAIREGQRAVALNAPDPLSQPYNKHELARIYLLVGEPEMALDILESLLKVPGDFSAGWLRLDPAFAALHGNPRFHRLVNGS